MSRSLNFANAAREYGFWAKAHGGVLMASCFTGSNLSQDVMKIPGNGILEKIHTSISSLPTEVVVDVGMATVCALTAGYTYAGMQRAARKLGL